MQNSSLNGKIVENTTFKNFFISPSSGDSGGAIGAVAAFLFKNNIMLAKRENNFYLGSQYSDNYIIDNVLKNLDKKSIQFKKMDFDDLSKYVASKISQGQLVAWFQGRMEFGPRALGNRSILCDPRNADAKKLINLKIKKREEFRPFAPSVLLEHADEYFYMNNIKEIPLMNVLVKVRESVRNIIPAVVHVDNTSRVHTVSMNINKNFHQLISDFKKITGVPILLNTSFNILNPIIENPTDAYNAFIESNIDILVLNNFYLEKI
jgi:carbamoyltransferase